MVHDLDLVKDQHLDLDQDLVQDLFRDQYPNKLIKIVDVLSEMGLHDFTCFDLLIFKQDKAATKPSGSFLNPLNGFQRPHPFKQKVKLYA